MQDVPSHITPQSTHTQGKHKCLVKHLMTTGCDPAGEQKDFLVSMSSDVIPSYNHHIDSNPTKTLLSGWSSCWPDVSIGPSCYFSGSLSTWWNECKLTLRNPGPNCQVSAELMWQKSGLKQAVSVTHGNPLPLKGEFAFTRSPSALIDYQIKQKERP